MVTNAKTITIASDSETARLLHEADETPVVLVVDGSRYRVHREPANVRDETDDPGADYDPERAISGMLAAAGAITLEEGDRWIEDIYRWRREVSRPVDRPSTSSSTPIGSSTGSPDDRLPSRPLSH